MIEHTSAATEDPNTARRDGLIGPSRRSSGALVWSLDRLKETSKLGLRAVADDVRESMPVMSTRMLPGVANDQVSIH